MSETETLPAATWKQAYADARVELSRLRGVVEAVQALADEWERDAGIARHQGERDAAAELMRCARQVRALAPVPSGEQADGEGGWVCATCGCGSTEHGMSGHPAFTCVYQPAWKPAARPVLSREALRDRLHDHMVAAAGEAGVLCQCDHVWRTTTAYAIHLADVLAGGEQA